MKALILFLGATFAAVPSARGETPRSLDLPFLRDSSALLSFSGTADETSLSLGLRLRTGNFEFAPYMDGTIESGEREKSIFSSEHLTSGLRLGFRASYNNHDEQIRADFDDTIKALDVAKKKILSAGLPAATLYAGAIAACPPDVNTAFCNHARLAPQNDVARTAHLRQSIEKYFDTDVSNAFKGVLVDADARDFVVVPIRCRSRWGINVYTDYRHENYLTADSAVEKEDVLNFSASGEFEIFFSQVVQVAGSLGYERTSNSNPEEKCAETVPGDPESEECVTATQAPLKWKGSLKATAALEVHPGWRQADQVFGAMLYVGTTGKISPDDGTDFEPLVWRIGLPVWFESATSIGGLYGLRPEFQASTRDTTFMLSFFVGADFNRLESLVPSE